MAVSLLEKASPIAKKRTIVVVGKESVGKSQLVSKLSNRSASPANFRGSTVRVNEYHTGSTIFIDTPGIHRRSDLETTRLALRELVHSESVVLVVQATHLDDDLAEMLPLVRGKTGLAIVTFWDKVDATSRTVAALDQVGQELGVELIPVDARHLDADAKHRIFDALERPRRFEKATLQTRVAWRIEPPRGVFDSRVLGPLIACVLLMAPALAVIFGSNWLAGVLHPIVDGWLRPLTEWIEAVGPSWARILLTAQQDGFGYGLLNMGPFLFVWALPTVVLYAAMLSVYKATGLVERMNHALHPWVRPLGLSGRDVVRILMGFGCKVPAVVSTRACSRCSRGAAVAGITFGAACSYQLPATLAVINAWAAAHGGSAMFASLTFLAYLGLTTVLFLWATAPKAARNSLNVLMTPSRPFLQWPSVIELSREIGQTLHQFVFQALPIFVAICIVASLLAATGVLSFAASVMSPVMRLFNLPAEATLPAVLSCIRKDGIFLLAGEGTAASHMTVVQVLTVVYLAGVVLPCLVTVLTVIRELGWREAASILGKQLLAALLFAFVLAWGGKLLLA